MKTKILALLFTFGILALPIYSSAQSKAEVKEWKKKLKQLDPMEYKALLEEKEKLQEEVREAKADAESYKNESESKDAEIAKLKQELSEAKEAQEEVAATENTSNTQSTGTSSATPQNGLVYKVQIGAFKNKDLSKYFENHKNFSGEVDADGTMKYTLGAFTDYWEANEFKKYLREMGVKDAWIVSYKDGKRVPLKDALEGVL